MLVENGFQYLLKPDVYEWLNYILEKTGSLSHFDRPEKDIG